MSRNGADCRSYKACVPEATREATKARVVIFIAEDRCVLTFWSEAQFRTEFNGRVEESKRYQFGFLSSI